MSTSHWANMIYVLTSSRYFPIYLYFQKGKQISRRLKPHFLAQSAIRYTILNPLTFSFSSDFNPSRIPSNRPGHTRYGWGLIFPLAKSSRRQCPKLDPELVVFRLCWNFVRPVAESFAKNRVGWCGDSADVGAREIADRMQGAVFPAVGAEAVCAYLSCGGGGDAVEYMANIVFARSLMSETQVGDL